MIPHAGYFFTCPVIGTKRTGIISSFTILLFFFLKIVNVWWYLVLPKGRIIRPPFRAENSFKLEILIKFGDLTIARV
jgi:hypothetical protein